MPFTEKTIQLADFPNINDLNAKAMFNTETLFAHRLEEAKQNKLKVAIFVATNPEWFGGTSSDVFITDGSSTFYVSLALALAQHKDVVHICTNNLAISTELDSHDNINPNFMLELLGGVKDFALNATFGAGAIKQAKDFMKDGNIAIASVHQLHPKFGPTAPERQSRILKKTILEEAAIVIIVLDWLKLATPPINKAGLVFAGKRHDGWEQLLKSQELNFVSSAPPDFPNTFGEGQRLAARQLNSMQIAALTAQQKYALNVFTLSQSANVQFIEIR